MKIHVAALPEFLPSDAFAGSGLAIVVDTLRFTTTACQALQFAASLRVCETVEQARHAAQQATHELVLCGERECRPIDGFHYGNSPLEFTADKVAGKDLLFTTTNGTRAVEAAAEAAEVWLAALVNRRAVCERLLQADREQVWIICSGTDRRIAAEDMLAAGSILEQPGFEPANDEAFLALAAWRSASQSPSQLKFALEQADGGRNLIASGYTQDIAFALQIDSLDTIPCRTTEHAAFLA